MIAALAVLVWFALLSEAIREYDSLTTHGIYGAYQQDMFERYGNTLDPEELAEYNIPGKQAAVISELNTIIASEGIFAENDIHNFAEYKSYQSMDQSNMTESEWKHYHDTLLQMESKLDYSSNSQTLDEWYQSPLMRLRSLQALEHTYIKYEPFLRSYISHDTRPVVVRAAENILQMRNASLIHSRLCNIFSLYAAVVGVFCTVAVTLFVALALTTDRMQQINLTQYSSSTGRNTLSIQFAATAISALALTLLLIVAAYIPFLLSGAEDFWHTPILSMISPTMMLYNITFGQYVFVLAVLTLLLSVSAGCFTLILARFSTNMVTMLVKTVPATLSIAIITFLSINMAFSESNVVFNTIFLGSVAASEFLVCATVVIVGVFAAAVITMREKRVDIT